MNYVRIFAGPDGESHFEDVDVPLSGAGASRISEVFATTGTLMRHTSGAYDLDWHPAPRRQFVVNLTGSVEITASDGESRILGPGEILLADDTTGKGHKSRAVGGEERLSQFIFLAT
jgi:hypothetical protein